jgi:hypothetical protein
MDHEQTITPQTGPTEGVSSRNHPRFFYSSAAFLLLLFMLWGFSLFYLQGKAYPGRPLTPPIRSLVIAHGVAMTLWMLLFIVQPLLIMTRNHRTHMRLGLFGTGLAAVATLLGINLSIASARVTPPEWRLWGLDPKQFMMISLSSILLFAVFVAIGILRRRKPDVHRPMMLLASLSILPPSMDRIPMIHNLFEGTVMGNFFGAYASSLVVGLLLIGVHSSLTRKPNRSLAIGYGAVVIVAFSAMQLAPTAAWASLAELLVP